MQGAHAAIEADYLDDLDEIGRKSATMIIDVTADTRQCPACFTEYARGPLRCPGCGLHIGV